MTENNEIKREGKNLLSKFEFTKLLSARGLELENGAKPKFDPSEIGLEHGKILSKDYVKIAKEEYYRDLLDLEVKSD